MKQKPTKRSPNALSLIAAAAASASSGDTDIANKISLRRKSLFMVVEVLKLVYRTYRLQQVHREPTGFRDLFPAQ